MARRNRRADRRTVFGGSENGDHTCRKRAGRTIVDVPDGGTAKMVRDVRCAIA